MLHCWSVMKEIIVSTGFTRWEIICIIITALFFIIKYRNTFISISYFLWADNSLDIYIVSMMLICRFSDRFLLSGVPSVCAFFIACIVFFFLMGCRCRLSSLIYDWSIVTFLLINWLVLWRCDFIVVIILRFSFIVLKIFFTIEKRLIINFCYIYKKKLILITHNLFNASSNAEPV